MRWGTWTRGELLARPPPSTFKSRGSILKDANTSGGQAEGQCGGLQQSSEFHKPLLLLLTRSDTSLLGFLTGLSMNIDNPLIIR